MNKTINTVVELTEKELECVSGGLRDRTFELVTNMLKGLGSSVQTQKIQASLHFAKAAFACS